MRGVLFVLADNQKRKPIKRREVEYLVGDALVEHAITDHGNTDILAASVFLGKGTAERHVKRAADDRAAVEIVLVRGELHRACNAEIGAGLLAVELGHHGIERSALGKII